VAKSTNFYYLQILHQLASVDGSVSGVEREHLAKVASSLGLSLEEIEAFSEPEPWKHIDDPVVQKLLIKDLFFVARADGRIDPKESVLIRDIIAYYRIPTDTVRQIDEFVKQGIAWIERGRELFGVLA
jgi:uncharacterized tellurite resistance protein B-like protein